MSTEQELQWGGGFGDEYLARSPGDVAASLAMITQALRGRSIGSAIEFGAGVGNNLRALQAWRPSIELAAVEVNAEAIKRMPPGPMIFNTSIQQARALGGTWDLAMTRGLLIHIPPADLEVAYQRIYDASKRFILLAEYYSPAEREIEYRGQRDMLWARDFAGDMLDAYDNLQLLDYGFVYRRDPVHPQDDVHWFLMEKQG